MPTIEEFFDSVSKAFPEAVKHDKGPKSALAIRIPKEQLLELLHWLKNREWSFEYLLFLTAIDWKGPVNLSGYIMAPTAGGPGQLVQGVNPPPKDMPFRDAFEVLYFLKSFKNDLQCIISVEIPREKSEIPSVVSLWACADWLERQLFDLMGITFTGHPNLKRILTPEFQVGHPLRKDYVHTLDKYD